MVGPELHVALATPDDAPAIQRLLGEVASPFEVAVELQRSYARLLVARRGERGRVLAFLLAWHVADEAHLIDVVVAPEERRGGIGRALLASLLREARARAARVVLLEVRKSNTPAIALYRGAGFVEVGERPRYYSDGEDALLMRLELLS